MGCERHEESKYTERKRGERERERPSNESVLKNESVNQ